MDIPRFQIQSRSLSGCSKLRPAMHDIKRYRRICYHDLVVNPARGGGHAGVHRRNVLLSTADAPGDDASLVPGTVARLADQGTAAVSLAGVHPRHSPGTHEAGVQLKEDAQPGVLSQVLLTDVVIDDRDDHLLEDLLVLPPGPELVLTPAVAHAVVGSGGSPGRLRQTDRTDVLRQLERGLGEEQGEVVVVVAGVKARVFLQGGQQ